MSDELTPEERAELLESFLSGIGSKDMPEWCGHFSITFDGGCMECGRREELARAWDQGYQIGQNAYAGRLDDGPVNPYREEWKP